MGIFLLVLAFCAQGAAASPPGARLAVVKIEAPGRTELFTVDALGADGRTLYAAGASRIPAVDPFWAPSWSPDGTRVAFTAIAGQVYGRYASFPRTMIALVSEDGSKVDPVAGTAGGFAPVFSPDGARITFAKDRRRWRPNHEGGADQVYASVSIWLADLAGGASTQLTPWRNRLSQIPSSFSPDGARLAFTRYVADSPPEAIAMDFTGSAGTVLSREAIEPVYSPDGKRIAYLRGPVKTKIRRSKTRNSSTVSVISATFTDIYIRDLDGGGVQRLTKTKGAAEWTPRWDPSGQRIAYTELKPFSSEMGLLGFGDAVREINADGTCSTEILSARRSILYGATWQPGAGREAGPIAC